MVTYRIWCKEPEGSEGADEMNFGSRQDWHQVAGKILAIDDTSPLTVVTNADTLRIFGHGSIDEVGGMTAKQLARFLYDKGLRQVKMIELVACDTAVNTTFKKAFAERLLSHLVSSKGHSVAITSTKGARGTLAPDAANDDVVNVKGKDVLGDAGKKSYSLKAGCFGMKTVST